MKKITGITVAVSITIASLLSGCGKASESHQEIAKEKINEAAEEVKEAIVDSNADAKQKATDDWKKFKEASEHDIAAMETQTRELGQKIAKAGKKEKVKLEAQLNTADKKIQEEKEKLKQRNAEFEEDVKKFDESVVTRNESFQREFKHDMDELGTSIKDLFKDNVK